MNTTVAAKNLKNLNERIYVPRHEYRPVEASAFRHLDLRFYDKTRDAFVAQGCTWLGDVENVSLKGGAIDFRTFIRFLVSADRTICVGLYHPKPKLLLRVVLRVIGARSDRTTDCESEFSNGAYMVTSNAADAGKLNSPPGFDMKYFPVKTPPEAVWEAHGQRMNQYLASNPGVHATPMHTSDEALEMQHRMQTAKAAYRKGVGFVSEDELRRLGANPREAAELKQAMKDEEGNS